MTARRTYDLTTFSLRDMTECGVALRALGPTGPDLHGVAQGLAQFLYRHLRDRQNGQPQCVLVRCFVTREYRSLSEAERELATQALGRRPRSTAMKCFTLMGTAGQEAAWNDRNRSHRYRAIPLVSEQFVSQFPMFSQLLRQFGVKIESRFVSGCNLVIDSEERTHNVFFVPDAVKSPYVPVQDAFVLRYGVRSVVGFGGILPSGHLFVVVLFANVAIPNDTADHFRTLALSAKLALLPHDRQAAAMPEVRPAVPRPAAVGRSNRNTIALLESQIGTLQQLLAVHERTVIADVTQRDLDEADLERLRRDYELLLNSAWDGICRVDLYGNLTFVNPAAASLLGWRADELLGRSMQKLVRQTRADGTDYTADDFPIMRSLRQGLIQHSVDEMFWRKNGRGFPVEYSSTPILEDGRIVGAVVTFRDISQRREAELALRKSEEQLRAFVDSSEDAIITMDARGAIVFCNRGAERLFGYAAASLLGQPMTQLLAERHHPLYWRIVLGVGAAPADAGHGTLFEFIGTKQDGTEFPLELSLSSWTIPSGRFFTGIIHDITGRKRAEQELQQALEGVRTLSHKLEAVREDERTRIARELHDELGVGLTCLKLDLSRIRTLVMGELAPRERAKLTDKVHSMTQQIDATITAVQRIVAELRPGVLDDLGLVAAIDWQCRDFTRRTGIECAFATEIEDLELERGQATAVFRICQEALTNVARHAAASEATVRLETAGNDLLLEVWDNGVGVPKGRLSDTKSFGLQGMRERARGYRGMVTIASEPGQGTAVRLRLPLH
ncbi:MAG: PAS domain S-box protein [Nitrospiraceae bacterium]